MVRKRDDRSDGRSYQQPRKGWERRTVRTPQPSQVRETFRADAPSPGEEILAKHDAELSEPIIDVQSIEADTAKNDCDNRVVCF